MEVNTREKMERESSFDIAFLFKKRFIGKGILGLGILLVMLVLATGSASAEDCGIGVADCECGDTVVADWTFTGDLSCPAGHGLIIGADDITIDGNGYKITGSENADACEWVGVINPDKGYCGILNKGYDNVVIKNLEIENFCTGIGLKGSGADPVVSNTIDNCEVHDNGNTTCSSETSTHGIHLCFASDSVITNSRIHHNTGTGDSCAAGGNGIFLYAGSASYENNVITKNELYDNRKGGFITKMKLHHARITDNNIYGNGQGGIILRCKMSNYNLIEGNNASCNYGDGIFIGGQNNTVRNNVVRGNIAGFRISPRDVVGDGDGIDMGRSYESENNEIVSNEACGNEGVDIEVAGGCLGNHGSDNTCDTTINYDDAGTTGCTYGCPEEINAEALAKELSAQGWTVYGTDRCSWCIKQKDDFGDGFKYINYVNCEENRQACIEAGISGIPCWLSPDGTLHPGYHNLTRLAQLATAYQAAHPTPTPTLSPTPTPGFTTLTTFAIIGLLVIYRLFKRKIIIK